MRLVWTIVLAAVLMLSWVSPAAAQSQPVAGEFFPQANGKADAGFVISNDGGIPFLDTFNRLGGAETLGRPISNRFQMGGFTRQLTERAMLTWGPNHQEVSVADTPDILSAVGYDNWLRQKWNVPQPDSVLPREGTEQENRAQRLAWLGAEPAFKAVYQSASDPEALYGLPTSPAISIGQTRVMRFQRAVLYRDTSDQAGTVKAAPVGQMLAESGLVPADALKPQPAPAPAARAVPQAQASRGASQPAPVSTGPVLQGYATWYGNDFQGSPMADGEPYDMWDPSTLACNSLPLGTVVRVTNRNTGAAIVARVTDTGSFTAPTVVDLSRAGFARLASPGAGKIPVTVEVVR